ncbi:unnamed protein product, partial [Phaeothamnion confervicola]
EGEPLPPPPQLPLAEAQLAQLAARLRRAGLRYPVICKPVEACGTQGSHAMVVVLDDSGLKRVRPPTVVQQYLNHDAALFKVFAL